MCVLARVFVCTFSRVAYKDERERKEKCKEIDRKQKQAKEKVHIYGEKRQKAKAKEREREGSNKIRQKNFQDTQRVICDGLFLRNLSWVLNFD